MTETLHEHHNLPVGYVTQCLMRVRGTIPGLKRLPGSRSVGVTALSVILVQRPRSTEGVTKLEISNPVVGKAQTITGEKKDKEKRAKGCETKQKLSVV